MCMCVWYMSGVCICVFLCFYNISACYQVGLNSPSIIKLDHTHCVWVCICLLRMYNICLLRICACVR